MNQAASATRRSPADPTATAGCCPMLSAPLFGLASATSSGAHCILRSLARQPNQQPNSVIPPQQPRTQQTAVSHQQRQHQPNLVGRQPQQPQMQPQQPGPQPTQGSQDYTSTNYSTSAPSLPLQHLLTNRYPDANCMALAAAALASAGFPHITQQQPLAQQSHSLVVPPINQTTINNIVPSTVNTLTTTNPTTTPSSLTNQVPTLSYNSYPQAQLLFNSSTHNVPSAQQSQQIPPAAAHSGPITNHQHTNSIPNLVQQNLNPNAHAQAPSNTSHNHRGIQQTRPLVTNTTLNSSAGPQQQAPPTYRTTHQGPITNIQQHQPTATTPAQQLNQVNRSIISEEDLSFISGQCQAFLICQFLASNPQFTPHLSNSAAQQQQVNSSRPPPTLPLAAGQGTAPVMISAQQPNQLVTQQPSEQVSESQQRAFHQATQSRSGPTSTVNNTSTTNSLYQPQQRNDSAQSHQQHRPQVEMNLQPSQQAQSQVVLPPPLLTQQQQPQQNLPPFYPLPQMEHALSILTSPQNTANFIHLMNMMWQSGLGAETHNQHHHQSHYHHHLHGNHHHHHHHSGQDGQPNGQEATIPLDSMAINESKPRGLTRAEIDSLPPYTHTNEKDARTCVICLSKFELKSKIRPLSCNHAFHAKCVDKWLRANRTCPICRRDALKTFNGKIKRV